MPENHICSLCGAGIADNECKYVGDVPICSKCASINTITCERCGTLIWDHDVYGDGNILLCHSCFTNHYTHCYECGRVIKIDDVCMYEGDCYCHDCYHSIYENNSVHNYRYKPEPIFYGKGDMFFGVELEIDKGGKNKENADAILEFVNKDAEYIYIKSDSSLNKGIEIVTHPMSLCFHMNNFDWSNLLGKCVSLGYCSHKTNTCGLHIHVNRSAFGNLPYKQEETISKILYFVEHHWNELLIFSRRTEYSMNRWAARYGYEHNAKDILDKAKKDSGRNAAVNLCNSDTIEFRMFRGTLKLNTLLAALQLVNRICNAALYLSEKDLKSMSWSEFVSGLIEPELIQYLKERRIYVNEIVL